MQVIKYAERERENFNVTHEATQESRLRLLHFKFVHNIHLTNILVKKKKKNGMKLKETKKCPNCQETDRTEHTFYQCHKLYAFFKHAKQFILTKTNTHMNLNKQAGLFGLSYKEPCPKDKRDHVNLILLKAKLFIPEFKYGKNQEP